MAPCPFLFASHLLYALLFFALAIANAYALIFKCGAPKFYVWIHRCWVGYSLLMSADEVLWAVLQGLLPSYATQAWCYFGSLSLEALADSFFSFPALFLAMYYTIKGGAGMFDTARERRRLLLLQYLLFSLDACTFLFAKIAPVVACVLMDEWGMLNLQMLMHGVVAYVAVLVCAVYTINMYVSARVHDRELANTLDLGMGVANIGTRLRGFFVTQYVLVGATSAIALLEFMFFFANRTKRAPCFQRVDYCDFRWTQHLIVVALISVVGISTAATWRDKRRRSVMTADSMGVSVSTTGHPKQVWSASRSKNNASPHNSCHLSPPLSVSLPPPLLYPKPDCNSGTNSVGSGSANRCISPMASRHVLLRTDVESERSECSVRVREVEEWSEKEEEKCEENEEEEEREEGRCIEKEEEGNRKGEEKECCCKVKEEERRGKEKEKEKEKKEDEPERNNGLKHPKEVP